MTSQNVMPIILECLDEYDKFVKEKVLRHKDTLINLFFNRLTMRIIRHSIQWQPYEYLFLDSNEKSWGELPVVNDFIEMLVLCDIIKVNYNKTHFKITYHRARDVLKHPHHILKIIDKDEIETILKYDDYELWYYLTRTEDLYNAYKMDKQLWLEGD